MAVVAGVVPRCLQVAPLDPSSGPDSGPGKNVGGSESGSRTVVRMHSCSMVVAVDYIHTHTHNGWKGAQWVSVTIPAITPTFSSTSRPAASPEVPRDTSSSHVPLGSHVIHPRAPLHTIPHDPISRPHWV